MEPIVNGLEQEFAGQITVVRLNAAEPDHIQLQEQYLVRGHPSFVVLDADGAPVQTFVGALPAETLTAALEAVVTP